VPTPSRWPFLFDKTDLHEFNTKRQGVNTMDREQLEGRVGAIQRKAEADKQLSRSISERTQELSELSRSELGAKAVEVATEASQLAGALLKARPSKALGKVEKSNAWNMRTKSRFIRLGELGTYHIVSNGYEQRYNLSYMDPDENLSDNNAFLAYPGSVADHLAELRTESVADLASVAVSLIGVAVLQEGLETLQVICEAAGVTVQPEATPVAA
jgi:hypothetical protein